ncbi:MAG: NfeD family protein [Tannerellaceae bacterium]|nr:NfeD family protein [Tannerellaceae bacterium]
MDLVFIIFLMLVAIVLVLIEIFLLPGITLAGIGGGIFAIGGLFYAYSVSSFMGNITLLLFICTFTIAFIWLVKSKSLNRVALHTNADSKLTSSRELGINPGDEGITLSRLAPIGKATINGIVVEAKSEEGFIDEEVPLVVVHVDGYNVIVTEKKEEI